MFARRCSERGTRATATGHRSIAIYVAFAEHLVACGMSSPGLALSSVAASVPSTPPGRGSLERPSAEVPPGGRGRLCCSPRASLGAAGEARRRGEERYGAEVFVLDLLADGPHIERAVAGPCRRHRRLPARPPMGHHSYVPIRAQINFSLRHLDPCKELHNLA
uniref:Uncharacterized protein n=1 Tax=Oryza sativa subsp. japonica TaxID=39947 RepID=Q654S2_ORYSJ|nr:hypothetical protein [Oryza sativa Japonica Group]